MPYKVTAALVCARDRGGKVQYYYPSPDCDTIIPWLDDDQAAHLLRMGMVEKVDGDESESAEVADGRPPRTATKAILVDWLAEKGYDRGELETQNKPELVELLDSVD
jgi:hypothetical protein